MGHCVAKPGCSSRGEETCEADAKCQKYEARPCSAAVDFAYFTCGQPKGSCDDALTCRIDPNAQEFVFPNSCVPTGYTQACSSQCQ
jgi:hypothetical protein